MTMGPFTIQKNTAGIYDNYVVKDRWSDLAAMVDSQEHAEQWIELFYKCRALEDRFLQTDIHVGLQNRLQKLYPPVVKPPRPKTAGKRGPLKTKSLPERQLELSCGAMVYVQVAA